jgi:hypothetical protein
MFDNFEIKTGIEEAAPSHADASKGTRPSPTIVRPTDQISFDGKTLKRDAVPQCARN